MPTRARPPAVALVAAALFFWSCRMDDPHPPTEVTPAPAAGQVLIGAVAWHVDYDAAVAVAREAGKPLWVHFGENPG